jgi:hypothetical protein
MQITSPVSSGPIDFQPYTVFTINRDLHAAAPGRSSLKPRLVCSTHLFCNSRPKATACHSFHVQHQELYPVQLETFPVMPSQLFYSDIPQSATPSFFLQSLKR